MNGTELLQIWSQVRSGLLETVSKFTVEDLDFTPFEGGYSARQIMLHIAQEEYGEIQYGITRQLMEFPPPFEETEYHSNTEIVALLSKVHTDTLRLLNGLSDEDLDGEIEAGWGGRYVLGRMIWHVIEHEIHHRGELSLMLGMLGHEGLDA